MKNLIILFVILFQNMIFSQWSNEWSSSNLNYNNISGWLTLGETGGKFDYRFYLLTESDFQIMNQLYSTSSQYSYTFTDAEILANYQIYSLSIDLTGDGIYEFYVLSYFGTAEPYRQSFKIFDITNGNILFERNDASFYYSDPTIWDADDDGVYECTFGKYEYPNFANYSMEVYNTGASTTGIAGNEPVQMRFELKQNFPNPFNPSTQINFELGSEGFVRLDIFDIKGELIKTLVSDHMNAGKHSVSWDGFDQNGRKAASGAYFYKIRSEDNIHTKKMILLK